MCVPVESNVVRHTNFDWSRCYFDLLATNRSWSLTSLHWGCPNKSFNHKHSSIATVCLVILKCTSATTQTPPLPIPLLFLIRLVLHLGYINFPDKSFHFVLGYLDISFYDLPLLFQTTIFNTSGVTVASRLCIFNKMGKWARFESKDKNSKKLHTLHMAIPNLNP